MSIQERIISILVPLKIPIHVAMNPEKSKDSFLVLIPLSDHLVGYGDNQPSSTIEELEIALYTKGNYLELREQITKLLLQADITITDRRYIEYEPQTKYHHYVIDCTMVNFLCQEGR